MLLQKRSRYGGELVLIIPSFGVAFNGRDDQDYVSMSGS